MKKQKEKSKKGKGKKEKKEEGRRTEKCRRMSHFPYGLKLLHHWGKRIIWLVDK